MICCPSWLAWVWSVLPPLLASPSSGKVKLIMFPGEARKDALNGRFRNAAMRESEVEGFVSKLIKRKANLRRAARRLNQPATTAACLALLWTEAASLLVFVPTQADVTQRQPPAGRCARNLGCCGRLVHVLQERMDELRNKRRRRASHK